MKFRIVSTHCRFDVDKMLEQYPVLYRFGFSIKEMAFPMRTFIKDENGEKIQQIEERKRHIGYVFLDSLEQLTELIKAVDNEVIISRSDTHRYGTEYEIEIYDGWR